MQSDEVAKNKENLNTFMLIHSIIYSIPFVLLFIYFKINVSLLIIITLSHLLIDVCSVKLKNKYKEKECLIFCSDQFIHIFIIYLCSSYMNLTIILSNMALISILAILILVKPTGVLISLAFKVIFKEGKHGKLTIADEELTYSPAYKVGKNLSFEEAVEYGLVVPAIKPNGYY